MMGAPDYGPLRAQSDDGLSVCSWQPWARSWGCTRYHDGEAAQSLSLRFYPDEADVDAATILARFEQEVAEVLTCLDT